MATPVPASISHPIPSHPIPSETVKCYIGGYNVYLESRGPRNGVHKTQNMVKLKKIRGMLCVGGPKNTNWITLVKAAVKLLKLPKSGVEILFNKTYVD